jgi:hypothetical protein
MTRSPLRVPSAIFLTLMAVRAFAAAAETGTVCVAPTPAIQDPRSAPGMFCRSGKLSFKIDSDNADLFSHSKSLKIEGLETGIRHRVVIYCNDKPQQSFTFRFSDFENQDLCLFINDLYKTAQLWESKRCPWCKCK